MNQTDKQIEKLTQAIEDKAREVREAMDAYISGRYSAVHPGSQAEVQIYLDNLISRKQQLQDLINQLNSYLG